MRSVFYFAYGSNMGPRRLQARVNSARCLTPALVKGYRFAFNKLSRDGSAKAGIEQALAESVQGVLYEIDMLDVRALRKVEGVGRGYEESIVKTTYGGEPIEALTFVPTDICSDRAPYSWYLFHILIGATAAQFDAAYLRWLADFNHWKDHDTSREERELTIYSEEEKRIARSGDLAALFAMTR